jgi:hypothetical protein
MMPCDKCKRTDRAHLVRQNPPGEPGVFVCTQCLGVDPEPEPTDLTPEQQLDLWVEGESKCPNTEQECCPDFSCCIPEMQWAKPRREEFRQAVRDGDDEKRSRLLLGSLTRMVAESDIPQKVYVAKGGPT